MSVNRGLNVAKKWFERASRFLDSLGMKQFLTGALICKVKHQGAGWSETQKKLKESQAKPFATLGLDQFARFYDRVHLLAPLDGPIPARSSLTSSGAVKPGTDSTEDSECMICMENAVEVVLPDCNHAFCKKCLEEWTAVSKTCPMCRSHTESNDTLWIMAENPTSDQLFSSLSDLLNKLRSEASSAPDTRS